MSYLRLLLLNGFQSDGSFVYKKMWRILKCPVQTKEQDIFCEYIYSTYVYIFKAK